MSSSASARPLKRQRTSLRLLAARLSTPSGANSNGFFGSSSSSISALTPPPSAAAADDGISEYERQRDLRVARNRTFLASLGLDTQIFGSASETAATTRTVVAKPAKVETILWVQCTACSKWRIRWNDADVAADWKCTDATVWGESEENASCEFPEETVEVNRRRRTAKERRDKAEEAAREEAARRELHDQIFRRSSRAFVQTDRYTIKSFQKGKKTEKKVRERTNLVVRVLDAKEARDQGEKDGENDGPESGEKGVVSSSSSSSSSSPAPATLAKVRRGQKLVLEWTVSGDEAQHQDVLVRDLYVLLQKPFSKTEVRDVHI